MEILTRNAKYYFELSENKVLRIDEESLDGRSGGKIFPSLVVVKDLILGDDCNKHLLAILDEISSNCSNIEERKKLDELRNKYV